MRGRAADWECEEELLVGGTTTNEANSEPLVGGARTSCLARMLGRAAGWGCEDELLVEEGRAAHRGCEDELLAVGASTS